MKTYKIENKIVSFDEFLKVLHTNKYKVIENKNEENLVLDLEKQISELIQKLSSTDYKAIKFAEKLISESEYAPIKQERQKIREQIRQLEIEAKAEL